MGALEIIAAALGGTTLAALGAGAYHALLSGWQRLEAVRTDVARQRNERRQLELSLETGRLDLARQQWNLDKDRIDRMRVIYPQAGRYPLLAMDSQRFLDVERGILFSFASGVLNISPAVALPEQRRRQIEAMAGLGAPAARAAIEAEPDGEAIAWSPKVILEGLLDKYHLVPGYHNVVVGETHRDGRWMPVTVDLQQAVHVLISGASGFGKSTLLAAIAKQLVASGNDVCAVDYGVNTFGYLADHLLYPIADDEGMTLALFQALIDIMLERKERFKAYPGARDLISYNRLAGEHLKTITVLVDEASVLFDRNSQLKQAVTTLSKMSRKFGVGMLLGGTDFLASTIPTSATGNFGARCGFHLRPSLSQSLLYCRDAANLHNRGRLLMMLPGVPGLTEIQAPMVGDWADLPEPREQEPLEPVEVESASGRKAQPVDPETIERILALYDQGESVTGIAREVFGHGSSYYIYKVKGILSDINDNNGAARA